MSASFIEVCPKKKHLPTACQLTSNWDSTLNPAAELIDCMAAFNVLFLRN